jgi:hypothetical protein
MEVYSSNQQDDHKGQHYEGYDRESRNDIPNDRTRYQTHSPGS